MSDTEIIETNFGVANTYKTAEGYQIELNSKLNEFPELKEKITRHELEHTRAKGFIGQRKVDAFTEIKFKDLFPFYRKYPKTFFQQHSPITYKNKTLFFEWSLIILYTLYLGLGFGIFYLIKLFSTDSSFALKVTKYSFIILFIVIILYLLGKYIIRAINKQANELPEGKKDVLSKLKGFT